MLHSKMERQFNLQQGRGAFFLKDLNLNLLETPERTGLNVEFI